MLAFSKLEGLCPACRSYTFSCLLLWCFTFRWSLPPRPQCVETHSVHRPVYLDCVETHSVHVVLFTTSTVLRPTVSMSSCLPRLCWDSQCPCRPVYLACVETHSVHVVLFTSPVLRPTVSMSSCLPRLCWDPQCPCRPVYHLACVETHSVHVVLFTTSPVWRPTVSMSSCLPRLCWDPQCPCRAVYHLDCVETHSVHVVLFTTSTVLRPTVSMSSCLPPRLCWDSQCPYRPVYHLDCVETHSVHVSYRHLSNWSLVILFTTSTVLRPTVSMSSCLPPRLCWDSLCPCLLQASLQLVLGRPVYHLDCVETHSVHVSYRRLSNWSWVVLFTTSTVLRPTVSMSLTGVSPTGLWSSFLSSSCYVCHQYSFHYLSSFLLIAGPDHFSCLCYLFGCLCYSGCSCDMSFLTLPFSVTPRIHLHIPITFISILASCLCCCPGVCLV